MTIADVLTHYRANVEGIGEGWRSIRCPFHDDSTASASVSLGRDAFNCHKCAIAGDPIHVIMKVEHIDYEAACDWAIKILGKSGQRIPQPIPRSGKRQKRRGRKWRALLD